MCLKWYMAIQSLAISQSKPICTCEDVVPSPYLQNHVRIRRRRKKEVDNHGGKVHVFLLTVSIRLFEVLRMVVRAMTALDKQNPSIHRLSDIGLGF